MDELDDPLNSPAFQGPMELHSRGSAVVCSQHSAGNNPSLLTKCLALSMFSSLADGSHSSSKAVAQSVEQNSPGGPSCPKVMLQVSQTDY